MISSILPETGVELLYQKSSLIHKDLEYNTTSVAMIPSLDLINHRNIFVSHKFAVSFTGALSNSYLYFVKGRKKFKKINMFGDINLNDAILSKILFVEKYSSLIELVPENKNMIENTKDYLVTGDENFNNNNYENAISFADLISDMIEMPYVNFIFASQDKKSLIEFNNCIENINDKIIMNVDSVLANSQFDNGACKFVKENFNSVYYDVTKNEINSLNELIRLLFYHGIIEDIFEMNFV
jgi:predicted solute-binding protein